MEYCIKVENTAINNGISKSTKLLINDLNEQDYILDYGCGLLRNTKEIYKYNKNIDILDTSIQIKKIIKCDNFCFRNFFVLNENNLLFNNYDKVICSYVLNVVQDKSERISIIRNIYYCLKDKGKAYIEVRTSNFIRNLKNYEEDKINGGIIIGNRKIRTYQYPYTLEELLYFINSIKDVHFSLIKSYEYNDSIIVILTKESIDG